MSQISDFYEKFSKYAASELRPIVMNNQYKANIHFQQHFKLSDKKEDVKNLPLEFDWRAKFPNMEKIIDQGTCGSCWAVSTVSAISDHCQIAGFGNLNLSYEHAMNCFNKDPCEGGNPAELLKELEAKDIVENCVANKCKCDNLGYLNTIRIDENSIKLYSDIDSIKHSLINNGPLIAGLLIYENFKHGKFGNSGIFIDNILNYNEKNEPVFGTPQNFLGCHSIVILGYGTESHVETSPKKFESVDYWICRNSWGSGWCDKGFFKIATHKINKLVQLEKPYDFKNAKLGGMLTFKISKPPIKKFFYKAAVEKIALTFLILTIISIVCYKIYKLKRISFPPSLPF